MVEFVRIPNTDIEIASHGRSHNRIIFFRTHGETGPISAVSDARVVFIGNPESKIKLAMDSGIVSRAKLADFVIPVGGNTYKKLRSHIDKTV